ncbi:glycosyltransferase [Atlantibacter sp.]|uniref:glycosyltransferase family 2 protein n=1 Tax=Atlantibacter sp. TaxID=1903473 RepID=UPI0028AFCBE5|nr:glycosyltransferase [Atlantibacter sp.]
MKYDVIIPFKNALQYLPFICSDLNNQDCKDFKVYFVSDDPDESSFSFFDEKIKFDFEVIKSKGNGPGDARNEGMKKATGDYILFIDVDDRIDSNYISCFNDKIKASCADIIECMYHSIDTDGHVISKTNLENYILSSDRFELLLDGDLPRLSWGKAYRRGFLEEYNITFPAGVHNGEDHIFLLSAYSKEPSIELIFDYIYKWVRHSESLTNRLATYKTIDDFILVSEIKKQIFECVQNNDEKILKFARRIFKEARVLQNKMRSENPDFNELIQYMRKSMLGSVELKAINEIIRNDSTTYWSDVM